MDDVELEAVATGQREFTKEEREWAISQHNWLWEYVPTQDTSKRDAMSDMEIAKEVQSASWDYVRCECMGRRAKMREMSLGAPGYACDYKYGGKTWLSGMEN